MITARWSINGIFKADAQKVYDEISTLENLTPENVLEKAKDPDSESHKCFEWDDKKAAHKYRLGQARQVIQFLVTEKKAKDGTKYEGRIFEITTKKNTYEPVELIMKNESEYQNLLKRAHREFTDMRNRYQRLSELSPIFMAIDALKVPISQ